MFRLPCAVWCCPRSIISAGLLLSVLTSVATARDAEAPRPNIVVLLADDLGRHDCGFMGGKQIATPHLDRLARDGVILDASYVLPVCSPTRAALLTGRYPMRHGLQVGVVRPWAQYGLPLEERTIASALADAGYATAIVGKWHLGHFQPEYLPTRRGFQHQYGHYNGAVDYFRHERDGGFDWHRDDRVCRDAGYSTHLLAQAATHFIKETAGKQPFFLYVPFNAVHTPHQVPDQYLAPYTHLKGERRKYAGMLAALDEAVGQIVAAVETAGIRQQTLFLFSSDNGGPAPGKVTDNGPYRGGKGTLYEGGVRGVACVTWDQTLPAGTTCTEPLHVVDWYPTFLKLAGARAGQPLPLDGLDVWPTVAQGAPSPHLHLLLNTTPRGGAVRAGNWKLVVKQGEDDPDGGPPRPGQPTVELFNLKADPAEQRNVAGNNPDKVRELRQILADYASQAVAPRARPKPANWQSPAIWGE